MKSRVIQSLCVAKRLSKSEYTAIQSFIIQGWTYHLYVYDHKIQVPPNVILKDANEILVVAEVYLSEDGTFLEFTEIFKFTLLNIKGGWWADLGIRYSSLFLRNCEYVFLSEINSQRTNINTKIIRATRGATFLNNCIKNIAKIPRHFITLDKCRTYFSKSIFDENLQQFIIFSKLRDCEYEGKVIQTHTANRDIFKFPIVANDVTFVIPISIDSQEILENFISLLSFLQRNFTASIIVFETGIIPLLDAKLIVGMKYLFQNIEPNRNNAKNINKAIHMSETPIVCIWNMNAFLRPIQLFNSIEHIRNHLVDFCFPYNSLYFLDDIMYYKFRKDNDFVFLDFNIGDIHRMPYPYYDGGIYLVNKASFVNFGMENECIRGTQYSGAEKIKRIQKLGGKVYANPGRLYILEQRLHDLDRAWGTSSSDVKEFLQISK